MKAREKRTEEETVLKGFWKWERKGVGEVGLAAAGTCRHWRAPATKPSDVVDTGSTFTAHHPGTAEAVFPVEQT